MDNKYITDMYKLKKIEKVFLLHYLKKLRKRQGKKTTLLNIFNTGFVVDCDKISTKMLDEGIKFIKKQ